MKQFRLVIGLALLLAGSIPLTVWAAPLEPDYLSQTGARIPVRLAVAEFDPLLEGVPAFLEPDDDLLSTSMPAPTATYLLQFTGPVRESWKVKIAALGVELYDYIPDYAFIAGIAPDSITEVMALPFVRWVGAYAPAYRLAVSLRETASPAELDRSRTLSVRVLPGADLSGILQRIEAWGGAVLGQTALTTAQVLRVELAARYIQDLAALDGIIWVETSLPRTLTNDVAGGSIMQVENVRADLGLYGAGQIVAVSDTGLDIGVNDATMSDDFEGRIIEGQAICGYFDGFRDTWYDGHGHGTHVAGSILGSGANSGSDPASHSYTGSFAGSAPEAQLIFQAVDDPAYSGLECVPVDLDTYLFGPAYDLGARIHSNSWGGPTGGTEQDPEYGGYDEFAAAVDDIAWKYPDMLVVYSAGNSGADDDRDGKIDPDSIDSPGTAKNILTVGASESLRDDALSGTWSEKFGYTKSPIAQDYIADAVDGMAAFSSRGPTDDGRIKPDVTAPGTMIVSSRSHHALAGVGWGAYDDDYIYMGGTSMSAPLTAGAAALVREWLVKQQSLSDPSAALLKALLVNGAVAMAPGQYGTGTTQEIPAYRPNPVSGWGRVDLVQTLTPSGTLWYTDTTVGLSTGDTVTYTLEMEKAGELRVVLAWTDYPGSPTAARVLVNDLDLEVVGPGGSSYGNSGVYQPGAACLRGGQWDRCNNVEGTFISISEPGTYYIVVHAHNVPNGPQPFALAANSYFIDSNTPPTIKSLPDRVVPVDVGWDKAIYLPDYVHDAEDDFADLTFVLTSSLPSQVVVAVQDDDYIAIDPVAGFTGTATVEVLVRDTGGLSATDAFQVEVTDENIPPAITLPDLALSQGDARTLDLWPYTEDLDDPDEVLTFTLDQSATIYAGKSITGGHYLNIRPYYLGVEQITVQVEDPQGAHASGTFSVTVTSGQPSLDGLPDLVANAGETLDNAVDLWAYANDSADSVSELAFSIVGSVPVSAGLTIDGNRYLDISPVANYVATIPVEVQVQDIDGYTDTDAFLLNIVSTMRAVYMPLVVRDWPPIPGTVTLDGIDNADGDGAYSVSWEAAERASGYVLQEATGADFAGAQVVYQGSSLSYAVTGKSPGHYYYRVKGTNSYGSGPWSTTQPVWVMPPDRFYPVGDATLFRGSPELNNGTDSELRVGYESCDVDLNGIVRSVIRFDLSEIPPGTEIASAELSLLLSDTCYSEAMTHTVKAYRAADNWSESSVTWNTGPGYAELYGSAQVKTEELQRYTLDITELVVAWVNGTQPNYGLVLRGPEFSGANSVRFSFFTREADKVYVPYLDIDYN